jgi:hypothetical protein
MVIHTVFVRTILGFCPKIHTFWLPTSIGGFLGPPAGLNDELNFELGGQSAQFLA